MTAAPPVRPQPSASSVPSVVDDRPTAGGQPRAAVSSAATPTGSYEAGSLDAPWNRPETPRDELETVGMADQSLGERVVLGVVIALPFLALLAAIPVAVIGGWLGWVDVVLAVLFYVVAGAGITVGFHRHFTHGSFRAARPLRVALAVAGSLALEGPVTRWVADHRGQKTEDR